MSSIGKKFIVRTVDKLDTGCGIKIGDIFICEKCGKPWTLEIPPPTFLHKPFAYLYLIFYFLFVTNDTTKK